MQRINNPADIAEEQNAASRIAQVLLGMPIIETSGDENHQIMPLSVWFKVKLSESGGDIVYINILQPDRHHPSLVYPTITNAISKLPEFKVAILKSVPPDEAYNHDTGVVSVAYELPRGGADHLIHELSENFEKSKQTGWANKINQNADTFPPPMAEAGSWLEKLMQMFKPASEKDIGM